MTDLEDLLLLPGVLGCDVLKMDLFSLFARVAMVKGRMNDER